MIRRRRGLLAMVAAAGLVVGAGTAASVTPLNLPGLVTAAQEIVVGTVASVSEARQGYVPYLQIEVRVSETIKGTARPSLTFRQLGMLPDASAETGRRKAGQVSEMPRFTAGESVILFLAPPSSLGFRTTVGLQQGKFTVQAGRAVNALDNAGLFKGVTTGTARPDERQQAMLTTRQGGVDARTFIAFVRQGVQQRWWK